MKPVCWLQSIGSIYLESAIVRAGRNPVRRVDDILPIQPGRPDYLRYSDDVSRDEIGGPVSVRFPSWLYSRVREVAAMERRTLAEMVRILAEEALATRDFPSIIFVDGPTGRRPAYRDGPDIWEIIEPYLVSGRDGAVLEESYGHLLLSKLDTALRFYERFPHDIEARIARNRAP
jgi:hypothetical protein